MDVIVWAQQFSTPFVDTLAQAVTILGEDMVAILLVVIFMWCVDRRYGARFGAILLFSGLVNGVLKNMFRVSRPWERNYPGYEEPLRVHTATGYSMPSGHTQTATTTAAVLSLRVKRNWMRIALFVLAALVGVSRILCRVHTWQDVVVGFGLGIAITFLFYPVSGWMFDERKPMRPLYLAPLAILAMAASPSENVWKVAGMLLTAGIGLAFAQKYIRFQVRDKLQRQIIKLALGAGVLLLIQYGVKPLLGTGIWGYFGRYALMGAWITAGAPWAFSRIYPQREQDDDAA
ncbi:MAG: phosphatase PAP2 family protein [Christensenellales bacterium]